MSHQCKCCRCGHTLTMAEALEDWCIVCWSKPRLDSSAEKVRHSLAHEAILDEQDVLRGSRKVRSLWL